MQPSNMQRAGGVELWIRFSVRLGDLSTVNVIAYELDGRYSYIVLSGGLLQFSVQREIRPAFVEKVTRPGKINVSVILF